MKQLPVLVFIGLALVFGTSCKRTLTDKDFFGSPFRSASKDFFIKSFKRNIASKNYAFQSSPTPTRLDREFFVNAKFSEEVSWKVRIAGLTSGAERTFEGISDTINRSNLYWRGGHQGNMFFRAGEKCQIELTILGSDITIRDTITVFSIRPVNATFNKIKQTLVDDFDGNTATPFGNAYPDRADGDVFDYNTTYPFVKVQQDQSYWWKSKDNSNNTYCGGADTDPITTSLFGKFSQTNPDSLYVNCYIYGAGKSGTGLSILAYEQDQVGGYELERFNDRWIYTLPITWTGWKLVSIKYSAFKKPSSLGCLGNCKLEPFKIRGFALSFDSYPDAGQEVEGAIDFFIVTEGGAFNPTFQ